MQIRVAGRDHHGGAGRERRIEGNELRVQRSWCSREYFGDASVGGATTTGASAVTFGVNPVRAKTINPPPTHTRATDTPQCL